MESAQLLGNFGEFLGAMVVVASVIYLAIQVKHGTQSTRLAATQSFAEVDNAFVGVINLSKELPDVLHRGAKGLSELEGADVIRFMAFHDQVFVSAQATYLQWRSNTLDESLWNIIRHACFDLLSQPGQQEWWQLRRHWFDENFRGYMDTAVDSGEGKLMHPRAFEN
jgi:hypothetical protein